MAEIKNCCDCCNCCKPKERKKTTWTDIIHVINCLLLAGFFIGIGLSFAIRMILL